MNKVLIQAAIIFQLLVLFARQFANISAEQEWNLWFMMLGMGVMIVIDAGAAWVKKRTLSRRIINHRA